MKAVRVLAALVPAGLLTACVMPDQLAQYQKDVAELQASVTAVRKSQDDLSKRVAAIESGAAGNDVAKRSDVADLRQGEDAIQRQLAATSDRIDQVSARVERLSQDVQSAKDAARRAAPPASPAGGTDPDVVPSGVQPSPNAPPAVPVPVPAGGGAGGTASPNALYTSAYADFSKGNYSLAIQGFEEYAKSYPDTELADNALYWIGECHFSEGAYKAAIDAFDGMLEKYPKSDKAAAANLKKALAFIQLNQIGQGIEQLRFVTANFPGTDEARIAADRLQALGKP